MQSQKNQDKSKQNTLNLSSGALLLLFLMLLFRTQSHTTGPIDPGLERQTYLNWLHTVPPVLAWLSGIIAGLGMLSNLLLALVRPKTPQSRKHLGHAAGFLLAGMVWIWMSLVWFPQHL